MRKLEFEYQATDKRLYELDETKLIKRIKLLMYYIYVAIIVKSILFGNITQSNKLIFITTTSTISIFIVHLIRSTKIRGRNIISLIVYALISTLMFLDVMYFSYFNIMPSISALGYADQLVNVNDTIKSILTPSNIAMILDIPLVIITYVLIHTIKSKKQVKMEGLLPLKQKTYNKTLIGLTLLTIVQFCIIGITGQISALKKLEFYSYHITDIMHGTDEVHAVQSEVKPEEQKSIIQDLKDRAKLKNGKYTGIGKGKNLIVIQMESTQDFAVGLTYNGQEITPNLNKLINTEGSLYYDNYYQLIGRGNTSDAEFTTQNSMYPSMGDPSYTVYEKNTFYGLPVMLKDNGYTPWVFHGYEKTFWNRENAYVNQGYERYVSQEDFEFNEVVGFGIKDEEFFDQSINYLRELDSKEGPFYAFMITLTSHTPFKMNDDMKHINMKPEHQGTAFDDYMQSVHYMDKSLGQFIDQLKQEGLYDDTVLALYGDHYGMVGSIANNKQILDEVLGVDYSFDEMMNVPLIIHIPGETVKETIHTLGSQLDFYPTMQNIMGYENKGMVFGRDLNNYEGYNFVAPQTHMVKGSIIDNEIMIEMSRDGIYENSKVINRASRTQLDGKLYRDRFEQAIYEINTSDYILKNNLMEQILNNTDITIPDEVKSIKLNVQNESKIKEIGTDIINELNQAYASDYRVFNLDLGNVFIDGYDTESKSTKLTDILKWLDEHTDTYLVITEQTDLENKYKHIKDNFTDYHDRLIPVIRSFDSYLPITFRGYDKVLLDLRIGIYTDSQVLDFITLHPQFGVIINQLQVESGLAELIEGMGINIFVEGTIQTGYGSIIPL